MSERIKPVAEEFHGYVAEILDNPDNVVSATGTTGLTPTPPESTAEAESYSQISPMPIPEKQAEKEGR